MRQVTSILLLIVLMGLPVDAATQGTITGRVENASTGRSEAGVDVLLFETFDGEAKAQTTTTDARGRYKFEGLATGPDHVYTLDARFDGGLFAGGAVSLPADTEDAPVIDTTLRVWPTTRSPESILLRRDDLFAILDGNDVGILESVTVVNTTQFAYIGRGEGVPGETPTLGFPLPAQADPGVTIIESDLDIPAIVPTDFGFAATVAIPPGTWKMTFTYEVKGGGGSFDLSRPTLYPTLELSVYASEPLHAESNRLEEEPAENIGGRVYARYSAGEELDAGDPLQVVLSARAGSIPVSTVGLIAVVVLAILGGAVALRRRPSRAKGRPEAGGGREALVRAIAALDVAREAGEIEEEEWARQRASLKTHLVALGPLTDDRA